MRKIVIGLTGVLLAASLQMPASAATTNEMKLNAFAHWVQPRETDVVKHHLDATLVWSRSTGARTDGTLVKEVCDLQNGSEVNCEVRKSESFSVKRAALTFESGLSGAQLSIDLGGETTRVVWTAISDLQRRWLDGDMVELYRTSKARGRMFGRRVGSTSRAAVSIEATNQQLCRLSVLLCAG